MRLVDSSDPGAVGRWDADRLLHERLVLANAVCSEVEVSTRPSGPLVSAALDLLRSWVREHTPPEEGEVHPSDGLDRMVVPDGSHDLMDALQVASAVCDDVAMLYTADTSSEYASDARRISESLQVWLETRAPARSWSAERNSAPLEPEHEAEPVVLSPVQQVAVAYGRGTANIDDVFSALVRAHRQRGFDPSAPSGTGPGEELDSWTGIVRLPSGSIPDERLEALRRAYGPFADQRKWVDSPRAGERSNQDPDNPYYRSSPYPTYPSEERSAVLFGVGLATVDEVIRSMWIDPDTGGFASDGSRGRGLVPSACLVSATGLTTLYYSHQISRSQLDQLKEAHARAFDGRVRDDRIPDFTYDSDYDGAQYMIVEPETADMSGWSLVIDAGYSKRTHPFEHMITYRSGRHSSLTPWGGEPVEVWGAFRGRHARLIFLVTPEGERLQM